MPSLPEDGQSGRLSAERITTLQPVELPMRSASQPGAVPAFTMQPGKVSPPQPVQEGGCGFACGESLPCCGGGFSFNLC
ncbi:hypothetical protein RvY_08144 [Ramazzottius varieornatus]|uniref:Uncharacterized protein n=1 Tax=Ramazzottius varieornatus TaxID=947166 RepID=A0A1D1V7J7_RAMVA|nr:hypothetical protein RvY_08144 [Ramazzottius varieornatus]